jgi:hypothetical protein
VEFRSAGAIKDSLLDLRPVIRASAKNKPWKKSPVQDPATG